MNRLRELRLAKGWRQADLARFLNTKPQTVSRYEIGERDIDSATICKLCDVFGCTADYLLGRSAMATPELNDEEAALLLAWRRSDRRAQDMVKLALEPFREEGSSQEAI